MDTPHSFHKAFKRVNSYTNCKRIIWQVEIEKKEEDRNNNTLAHGIPSSSGPPIIRITKLLPELQTHRMILFQSSEYQSCRQNCKYIGCLKDRSIDETNCI